MDYETAIGILRATADFIKQQEEEINSLKKRIEEQRVELVDLRNALR